MPEQRNESSAAQGQRECVVCGQPLTLEGKCPRPQETLCTMTDEGPEVSSAASPSLKADIRTVATALVRTDHTRRCEGFYRCTCIVGKADAALRRIEEALSHV